MADIVSKILVRQGTDAQRRTANSTGITFSSGEPAYCTDTKRLFIGDGITPGGQPVGSRNLGIVNALFGSSTNGLTTEAITLFQQRGASVGDFLYDKTTRNIYSLSAVTSFPPLSSNLAKYDSIVLVNTNQFQLVGNSILTILNGGIRKEQLYFDVVDGASLEKTAFNQPIQIKTGGVQNFHLKNPPAFTVKGNSLGSSSTIQDIFIYENHLLGRTATSTLTSIPFSTIVAGGLIGENGIFISGNTAKLDEDYFRLEPDPGKLITLGVPVSADSTLIVNGTTTLNTTVINGGRLTSNVPSTFNNNIRVNATLYSPSISAVSQVTVENPLYVKGSLNVNAVTNSLTGTTTIRGSLIATGASQVQNDLTVDGTVYCLGDVVAFYTPSDLRLKSDLKVIDNAVEKVSKLTGYEFTYNSNSPDHLIDKTSYGLIAQDVKKALPLAVNERPSGYMDVNYEHIIPLLVESVKQLNFKIEHLENELRKSN